MRISDWSSDVCSSDLQFGDLETEHFFLRVHFALPAAFPVEILETSFAPLAQEFNMQAQIYDAQRKSRVLILVSRQGHCLNDLLFRAHSGRSEEHTSELQSLMRISYAVFCLKKKKNTIDTTS